MKKILYISYDGMTDQLGQSQVIPYLRELTKAGYRFTLLSVEKKDKLKHKGPAIRALMEEAGIEWRTITYTSRPPILSKIYDQRRLNTAAKVLCRDRKFDLVHCRSYVAGETGLKLLKRFKIPFLFDMRGFWVNERVDSGLWNLKNPLYRFLFRRYKKKEQQYFLRSAHIISLTHTGKEELISNYHVAAEKISVIPCCADMDLFDYHRISEEQKKGARKKFNLADNARVLSYLGSLGGWYLTDEMLDFFVVLKEKIPTAVFLLITHNNREQIMQQALAKGIPADAIRIQPSDRKDIPLFLSISDWNIFFIKPAYSKIASSPTKQGEVMGMGIPIICNDIGDTGRIVTDLNCGVIANSFNRNAYLSVLDNLEKKTVATPQSIREGAFRYYDLQLGVTHYLSAYKLAMK